MPSSPSTRIRAELQAAGENLNTWGNPKLNAALQRLEEAICGRTTFALSGTKTLTSTNYVADEARAMFLDITSGTGGTVTIPSVEKVYLVRNACSAAVVITTGAGNTASFAAGEVGMCACNASDVYKSAMLDMGGAKLLNLGTPTLATDAVTKAYADALAMAALAGSLPAQGGNAGKFMTTNGTVASWDYAEMPWTFVASNITLAVNNAYGVNTAAVRALALPAIAGLTGNQIIRVADVVGSASSNNITVTASGTDQINGVASDPFIIDVSWGDTLFVPLSSSWRTVVS